VNNFIDLNQIIAMENHAIVEDEAAKPETESDANPVVSSHVQSSLVAHRVSTSRVINNSNGPSRLLTTVAWRTMLMWKTR
jgi:hypothetical protein